MWTLAKAIQHPQPQNTQTQDTLEQSVLIRLVFFLCDITDHMDAQVSIWDEVVSKRRIECLYVSTITCLRAYGR